MNLGWTQIDIASFTNKNVDWKRGYVTYKRKKEKEAESVPTVTFLLWDETFELLKKHRSDHGELVLVNENGVELLREIEKDDGNYQRIDNVAAAFGRLLKNNKLTGKVEFKQLRKTSPYRIETNDEWSGRGLDSIFLGHAPNTTAGQHYARRVAFPDDVMRWLGEQYGFMTRAID